jgi:hypothetical protein
MRNLLALFAFALLTFVAVGWYLDWYKIKADPAPAGHQNVTIDFNRDKIADDVQKGVKKSEEKLQGVLEKEGTAKAEASKPPESTPGKQLPNE